MLVGNVRHLPGTVSPDLCVRRSTREMSSCGKRSKRAGLLKELREDGRHVDLAIMIEYEERTTCRIICLCQ